MESTEAPVTYLYHWVEKYRVEAQISPIQWYASKEIRARFWYWLEHVQDKKPMVISYSVSEEMCGTSIEDV